MTQEFANPIFLWLLISIPLLFMWEWYAQHKKEAPLKMPLLEGMEGEVSAKIKFRWVPFALRGLAIGSFIVALARPQVQSNEVERKTTEGIDIVLSVDISGSMLSKDLKPNRLEALKRVASQFIQDRINDRIGLVVYSGESYTRVPVTSDKHMVQKSLEDIKYGQIEDGTAIGLGLSIAINRLKDSKAKSKVVILMTDGVNNRGAIDPKTAGLLAKKYNIRVYTIGIGTNGMALSPVDVNPDGSFRYDRIPVEIDEKLLKHISKTTHGKYFRATSNKQLALIYKEIDALEKTEVEEFKYTTYQEKYRFWVLLALTFLLGEFVLKYTYFRKL